MKFGSLIAILTFSAGAAFTLIDIGFDMKLAAEYWNDPYCTVNCRSIWDDCMRNCNCTDFFCFMNCIKIRRDCFLKCPNNPEEMYLFFILTTMWIILGGLVQSILVARYLCRGDARLIWLPKSIRFLLLICAPILMAPVIVNVYGVIFVTRHADEDGIQDGVLRFEIV